MMMMKTIMNKIYFDKKLEFDPLNNYNLILSRINDKFLAMKNIADNYLFNRKTFMSLKDKAKLDKSVFNFNILSFIFNDITDYEDSKIEKYLNDIFIKDSFEIITTFKKVTLNLRMKNKKII